MVNAGNLSLDFLVYGPRNPLGHVPPNIPNVHGVTPGMPTLTICFFGRYSSGRCRRDSAQIRWRSLVADRLPHGIRIGLHHEVRSFGSSAPGYRRRCRDHRDGRVNRGLRRRGTTSPRNHHHDNHHDHDAARAAATATSCGADGKGPAHRTRTKPVLTTGDCAPGADGPSWRQLAPLLRAAGRGTIRKWSVKSETTRRDRWPHSALSA